MDTPFFAHLQNGGREGVIENGIVIVYIRSKYR
jgi:hypothetical protein